MDNGPICEKGHGSEIFTHDDLYKRVVHPMMLVGYWGKHGLKAPAKQRSAIRSECFDPTRDIAVPQWHDWNMVSPDKVKERQIAMECTFNGHCQAWGHYLRKRAKKVSAPMFFRGQLGTPGHDCSAGIRPWIRNYCERHKNVCQLKGDMTMAPYAMCPAGWACWSSRVYDAFHKGTVPILLADGMAIPFSRWLDYDELQVAITTGEPTSLEPDGGAAFSGLVELGTTWIRACRTTTSKNSDDCISHPVSQTMANIARDRHLFGWTNPTQNENAFAMFEIELAFQRNRANVVSFGDHDLVN